MSKYQEIRTEFRDESLFRQALAELQAAGELVFEHHPEAAHLYGYLGDARSETAHYIVRRRHIDYSSNDIGWRVEEDGGITAVVSDYDTRNARARSLRGRVKQEYARQGVHREARRRGYRVEERRNEQTGHVHMRLVQARGR